MHQWIKWNRYILVIVFFTIGSVSCTSKQLVEEPKPPEIPFSSELDAAIDQVLAQNPDYDLGISAAVVFPDHSVWRGASGNSQPNVPVTTEMLFNAGSIQKNFEAALVLTLVEQGIISLDDPVSKYLPALRNVDGGITLRQLLNHTSGIFNVFEHPDFPWVKTGVDYSKSWEIEEVFNTFVSEPYGPPGYAQHYSSTNYLLITSIIEEATGSSVPLEIKRRFLEPMKLDHTFISMGDLPPDEFAVAHPWADLNQDGVLEDLDGIPQTWIVSLTHPVMFSTPIDLATWMQALYQDNAILQPDSLQEMLIFPEIQQPDPEGGKYGLGVVDYSDILGEKTLGHGGSALGYSAGALYLPEYRLSVAWMINTGESPHELSSQMMSQTWSALI
jgi:D-alanyl-D-alanine carboxypeptidase